MKKPNWSHGPHTLVQCSVAERDMNGDWYLGEHVEDMTAEAAEREFAAALERGAEPILEDWGAWAGWSHPDEGAYLYGDCDDTTYEAFYGEPYGA